MLVTYVSISGFNPFHKMMQFSQTSSDHLNQNTYVGHVRFVVYLNKCN